MKHITPEQAGISAAHVLAFYKELENAHLSTHSVILARGDAFFSEQYYAPFHKDFKHRMYSSSKSFVSIAIGFCLQDGLLSLDDPLIRFFPEYKDKPHPHATTIRELLQMTTTIEHGLNWFRSGTTNRAGYYFENPSEKFPDTIFYYDSSGSFMLGAVVERVTGKPFLSYLQEKVLNDTGFSKDAYCLQCPGGHSWGDSGVMCTTRDLWRFARFVLNKGTWEGKRYLNKDYIERAITPVTPNNPYGFELQHDGYGYGYQFWGAPQGCFATLGMGNQVSLCDPKHDFIMVMTADNQGNPHSYERVFFALYRHIIAHLGDPLPSAPEANAALTDYLATQRLFCLYESPTSPFASSINGKTYRCDASETGIRWFRLELEGREGRLIYENQQGEKCLRFGFGHNVFEKFPEEGYSDLMGTVPVPGHRYDAACSADWPFERQLRVRVQIIDKYFGNLAILFGFRNEREVTLRFFKTAEAFLNEYQGFVNATLQE